MSKKKSKQKKNQRSSSPQQEKDSLESVEDQPVSSGEAKSNKKSAESSKSKQDSEKSQDGESIQSTRETVESIVVAFVLAFLFRAFVAEAFVIPTGSMAPTLMGAHKDIFCAYCGENYQASASDEYDSTTSALNPNTKTLASCCANCRAINAYDFRGNSNHETFSGDRILVSKFDYVLSLPKRWDVLVFKFPGKARMNYIKRLIGLPGEALLLKHGDVYVQGPDDPNSKIARKPPHKIQAMKQLVSDTEHRSAELIAANWPCSWQPLPEESENWQVTWTEESFSATSQPTNSPTWLRYYHKFPSTEQWLSFGSGLEVPDRYSSRLITDYLAYNTSYWTRQPGKRFDLTYGTFDRFLGPFAFGPKLVPNSSVPEDQTAFDIEIRDPSSFALMPNDGYHWVGDLCGEFDVEIASTSGQLFLDLVEFGIHFRCTIDIGSGEATVQALDSTASNQPLPVFGGQERVVGATAIQGPGNYRIELANIDDQIVLWVNGSVVELNAQYDLGDFRSGSQRRPHWSAEDPLDAAPLGIGSQGLELSVQRARVHRDIYYIAAKPIVPGDPFTDYVIDIKGLNSAIVDRSITVGRYESESVVLSRVTNAVYSHPEWWSQTNLFDLRRHRDYQLEEQQYFPMGDNSAASSDARVWSHGGYVDEKYLLGKALLVFFPHTWNSPVPFWPNFQRMGIIR